MLYLQVIVLITGAFWLGACPFSVWVGRWMLHADIRKYGDGNPGAYNVFLAGGWRAGTLALLLDIGKGMPFVYAAHSILNLPEAATLLVGAGAILGHVFSPFLGFGGGKAVAVTYGVLLAVPQPEALVSLAILTLIAYLIIDNHAWTVVTGAGAALVMMLFVASSAWYTMFMIFVMVLYYLKFYRGLRTAPRPGRLLVWLQSRR